MRRRLRRLCVMKMSAGLDSLTGSSDEDLLSSDEDFLSSLPDELLHHIVEVLGDAAAVSLHLCCQRVRTVVAPLLRSRNEARRWHENVRALWLLLHGNGAITALPGVLSVPHATPSLNRWNVIALSPRVLALLVTRSHALVLASLVRNGSLCCLRDLAFPGANGLGGGGGGARGSPAWAAASVSSTALVTAACHPGALPRLERLDLSLEGLGDRFCEELLASCSAVASAYQTAASGRSLDKAPVLPSLSTLNIGADLSAAGFSALAMALIGGALPKLDALRLPGGSGAASALARARREVAAAAADRGALLVFS